MKLLNFLIAIVYMLCNGIGFLIVSVLILWGVISVYKKWRAHNRKIHSCIKLLICLVSYVLIFLCMKEIMLGEWPMRSTVDITPVIQMRDMDIDLSDIDAVIEKLNIAQNELGYEFEITNQKDTLKSCRYHYLDESFIALIYVSIAFFDNKEDAKKEINERLHSKKYSYLNSLVKISDNLEVVLGNSTNGSRTADTYHAVPSYREVNTFIRIDNMTIAIAETGRNDNTIGQASSHAIETLCQILIE